MMDHYKKMYQQWLETDLSYIEELMGDIDFYHKLYNKNIFKQKLPSQIQQQINEIKKQIEDLINDTELNIKTLKDRISLAKDFIAQSQENRGNAVETGGEAGNTPVDVAGIKQ